MNFVGMAKTVELPDAFLQETARKTGRRALGKKKEGTRMKEYLSIGEIAKIFDMDVQLLRYYDARGLFVPAVRHPENGRRYYHFDQVYLLATIRYLRRLGYSLEQVEAFVSNEDVGKNMDSMTAQAEALRRRCEELMATVDTIQKKIRFIQRETPQAGRDTFRHKTYPTRPFLHIGEEIDLFTYQPLYFYPLVGFYTAERKWFGAYLYREDGTEALPQGTDLAPDTIPAGEYLCGYHYGNYTTIRESIGRLYAEGERQGFVLDGCVVTLNIIDQFSEGHPDNYITALEARILSKR